jgi:Fibrobacter succinogenes major domain (Fib_succ_major)
LFPDGKKGIATNRLPEEFTSATVKRFSLKITVCHHDAATGKNKTIKILETDWPAHQAHGDLQGDCSAVITTICCNDRMVKNLDVSTYRNGDPINLSSNYENRSDWAAAATGARCYYNNDSSKYATYGKLYNWYAVNDARGIAPVGWHVPSDAEWNILVRCIDPLADTTIANAWTTPKTAAAHPFGFSGLPGGFRYVSAPDGQYF